MAWQRCMDTSLIGRPTPVDAKSIKTALSPSSFGRKTFMALKSPCWIVAIGVVGVQESWDEIHFAIAWTRSPRFTISGLQQNEGSTDSNSVMYFLQFFPTLSSSMGLRFWEGVGACYSRRIAERSQQGDVLPGGGVKPSDRLQSRANLGEGERGSLIVR